jgi:hypothetical protein
MRNHKERRHVKVPEVTQKTEFLDNGVFITESSEVLRCVAFGSYVDSVVGTGDSTYCAEPGPGDFINLAVALAYSNDKPLLEEVVLEGDWFSTIAYINK